MLDRKAQSLGAADFASLPAAGQLIVLADPTDAQFPLQVRAAAPGKVAVAGDVPCLHGRGDVGRLLAHKTGAIKWDLVGRLGVWADDSEPVASEMRAGPDLTTYAGRAMDRM